MKVALLVVGFGILIVVEILRVYYIMPFPGSQEELTIGIAYYLHNNINYFRLLGLAMASWPFLHYVRQGAWLARTVAWVVFGFYFLIFYMFNFQYRADTMFLQMKRKDFKSASENKKIRPKQLVIGVERNGESKAYPIEVIGYHHQVRDSIGGDPVMVTYCTVCRTGRVFSPLVDGKPENFRLVGMDHYNAMFEDGTTKSWWRQVSGEAIVGPLKGRSLTEIPSFQMTLAEWTFQHPNTKILQPDTVFKEAYEGWKDYDEGRQKGRLERKDSLSWQKKSWVVGVQIGMASTAYDWIQLQEQRVINDEVNGIPILVLANPDSMSFHVYERSLEGDALTFSQTDDGMRITDSKTGSRWNWDGRCDEGLLKGRMLKPVQAYQEYWHSWLTFHPLTRQYTKND
ncbi:MAG TPA: DUF3179 domain-containing (seleno)protein [Cyclobacteriaceae bacterium]|nr:DUF3179 domain-containing (seleno)protein [Cyclobacteriaceae bacterium]